MATNNTNEKAPIPEWDDDTSPEVEVVPKRYFPGMQPRKRGEPERDVIDETVEAGKRGLRLFSKLMTDDDAVGEILDEVEKATSKR